MRALRFIFLTETKDKQNNKSGNNLNLSSKLERTVTHFSRYHSLQQNSIRLELFVSCVEEHASSSWPRLKKDRPISQKNICNQRLANSYSLFKTDFPLCLLHGPTLAAMSPCSLMSSSSLITELLWSIFRPMNVMAAPLNLSRNFFCSCMVFLIVVVNLSISGHFFKALLNLLSFFLSDSWLLVL